MATAGRRTHGPAHPLLKERDTLEVMIKVTLVKTDGPGEWDGANLAYDLAETIGNELGTVYLDAYGQDSLDSTAFTLTAVRSGDAYLAPGEGSQR